MAKKFLPKSDFESLQFIRWVLFIVNAANAAGIELLNRQRLHLLLFISFASAPYYGILPLRQRAQRTSYGPYYRAAHIAIGNLALSGLVEIVNYKGHIKSKSLQFEAEFKLTKNGLAASQILRESLPGKKLYGFLLDLCLGISSLMDTTVSDKNSLHSNNETLDKVLELDLSYQQALKRASKSLYIQDYPDDESPTVAGLHDIGEFLRKKADYNPKDILKAYHHLLMRRSA